MRTRNMSTEEMQAGQTHPNRVSSYAKPSWNWSWRDSNWNLQFRSHFLLFPSTTEINPIKQDGTILALGLCQTAQNEDSTLMPAPTHPPTKGWWCWIQGMGSRHPVPHSAVTDCLRFLLPVELQEKMYRTSFSQQVPSHSEMTDDLKEWLAFS